MGIITSLDKLDKQLLIWCNNHHSGIFDSLMIMATDRFIWIPFYLLIILFIYKKAGKEWWMVLLTLVITIALADLFASSLIKPIVQRLRPCHNDEISHLLNLPLKCGGMYGFISSHAANTFALATFMWLYFGKEFSWMLYLFAWAAIVSYSRIYLGAHYPGDIIFGMISGIFWAIVTYKSSLKIWKKKSLR